MVEVAQGHAISVPPGAWNKGYEPTVPWRPLPSDEKNAKRWLTLHQKLATLALQATKDARLSALTAGSRVCEPVQRVAHFDDLYQLRKRHPTGLTSDTSLNLSYRRARFPL
mmetsp:Transcript_30198/g.63417  ORF Transcript_30198/g.63417 Transcript_30198/m.63417 type:complete len:111 (+) Transcript_30198:365-697(+)